MPESIESSRVYEVRIASIDEYGNSVEEGSRQILLHGVRINISELDDLPFFVPENIKWILDLEPAYEICKN